MRWSITMLVGVLAACGGETQQAQGPGAGGADSKPDAAATGGAAGADAALEGATNPCAGKACGESCHSWRVNAEACDISGQCSEANYAICSCGACTPACQAMGACNTGSSGGGAAQGGAGGAGGGTGGTPGTGGRNPCEPPPAALGCFTAEQLGLRDAGSSVSAEQCNSRRPTSAPMPCVGPLIGNAMVIGGLCCWSCPGVCG